MREQYACILCTLVIALESRMEFLNTLWKNSKTLRLLVRARATRETSCGEWERKKERRRAMLTKRAQASSTVKTSQRVRAMKVKKALPLASTSE